MGAIIHPYLESLCAKTFNLFLHVIEVAAHHAFSDFDSYTVSIGGKQTANYEMVNNTQSGAHPHIKATKGDTVVGGNDSTNGHPSQNKDGKLQNTRGYELPSTGGIGTTIFYVAGIVLVLGAAAIIIARRKAEQE